MRSWIRARLGRALAAAAVAVVVGCSAETPPPAFGPIEVAGLYVYYPTGGRAAQGLVRGRGLPGTVPDGADRVVVRSHPSGHRVEVPLAPDGGFGFRVIAISGDVLELRAAGGDPLALGAPVFVEVPPSVEPFVPHVCCPRTNTCQSIYDRDNGLPCPPPAPGLVRCEVDEDCAPYENQALPLEPDDVRVTAPDARGRVSVRGEVVPNALVTIANVGKSAVAPPDPAEARALGRRDPGLRLELIADDRGRFTLEDVPAVGDDELVVVLYDLLGFRSAPYGLRVPDPPLAGVDVLGVTAWTPLVEGRTGRLAVRLAPFGADGRGLCPDDPDPADGLELCVGGGLDHRMVEILEARIGDVPLDLTPAQTGPDLPYRRGIEGDVRAPPSRVVLIVGRTLDPVPEPAVEAIATYVEQLRPRDRVAWVDAFRFHPRLAVPFTGDRTGVAERLRSDLSEFAEGFQGDLLLLVEDAVERLRSIDGGAGGRVLVVTGIPPADDDYRDLADRVLDLAEGTPSRGPVPIDVVSTVELGPAAGDARARLDALTDLARFSEGEARTGLRPEELGDAMSRLLGRQLGSFLLLYDVAIPPGAAAGGELSIRLQVEIDASGPAETTYRGPLRVASAPNP